MIRAQTERIAPMEADEVATDEIEAHDRETTPPARSHTRRGPGPMRSRRVQRAVVLASISALLGTGAIVAANAATRSRQRSHRRVTQNIGNRTLLVSLPFSGIVVSPATQAAKPRAKRRARSAFPIRSMRRAR